MKLSKSTLFLIALALGLGSFVYFYEIRGKSEREEIKAQQQKLFSFNAEDIQALNIKTQNTTLQLERRNSTDKPEWSIKSTTLELANDAIVSYLTDLLVKGKSERTLLVSANELKDFGLEKPQATIEIKLKNGQNHQVILGNANFNNSFLYAQIDPKPQPDGKINILLVSTDFKNAVNRDLAEWKEAGKETPSTPLPSLSLPTPSDNQSTPTPLPSTPLSTPSDNQSTSTPLPSTPLPTPTSSQ
ncbi:MAG TPA: DUF4340 domain-containing protein [Nostocaceae cyanobacterium]|nr:DUF4340 domain-containing protein [Nostocaceae cyanobacterium]